MRKQTIYTCEICGKSSNNESKIATCEKSHVVIEKIGEVKFDNRYDNNTKYPLKIELVMSDGKKVSYSRKNNY